MTRCVAMTLTFMTFQYIILNVAMDTEANLLSHAIKDLMHLKKKMRGPVDMGDDARDPKHGIVMGVPLRYCDDGVHGIDIDWDPQSSEEYTCHNATDWPDINKDPFDIPDKYSNAWQSQHICLNETIDYGDPLPLGGNHRPLWPKFGEYRYLPPQRWVHSLEHGAIVFLYHPCMYNTPPQVLLKNVVKGCIRKHIIAPYRHIPDNRPFVLMAFGHARFFDYFDTHVRSKRKYSAIRFIKKYAMKASETHVVKDGQYDAGLIKGATMVPGSTIADTKLCPN